jgi:LysR family transcriptional activator of mexEF-oprN operon
MTDLRLFDLNLLVAFDALMAERNVTRAAQRVGVGQPAMSYALSRLRELFGDELFVRASGTMQPTTRALELAAPIVRVLADIRNGVLQDRVFNPEESAMTFRVGASDHSEIAVLTSVFTALRAAAPSVRIVIRSVDRDRLPTMLDSGVIDLALGYFPDAAGGAEHTEVLFHEDFVCIFDARACKATAPLQLKVYLELPHIIMSLRGELTGVADSVLARQGAKRFVLMGTPHFIAIPYLLHGLRAVAAVPRRLAEHCSAVAGLTVSPVPIKMDGYDVSMRWHIRTDTDPAHRWFRELIRETGRSKLQNTPSKNGKRGGRKKKR